MKGRRVAVFLTEYKKWWAGEIKAVHGRRTVRENFEVLFDGEEESGVAEVRLDAASYGKSSNWVLLPQVASVCCNAASGCVRGQLCVV